MPPEPTNARPGDDPIRAELLGKRSLSSAEIAYRAVKQDIFDGKLAPGERVVEDALARSLELSRTPVREALLKLERENLVMRTDRGMVVRSLSPTDVDDLMMLRIRVEGLAARLAAERARPHDVEMLRANQEEAIALLDSPPSDHMEFLRELSSSNHRFHFRIAEAAEHELVLRVLAFVQAPFAFQAQVWYDNVNRRRALEEHQDLIELIAVHDADGAEAVMTAHITRGMKIVTAQISLAP